MIECPYCESEFEAPEGDHDTCASYDEECPDCGKKFVFEVEYEKNFYPRKADCLNGGEHDWRQTHGAPANYFAGRFRCANCSAEKHEPSKPE